MRASKLTTDQARQVARLKEYAESISRLSASDGWMEFYNIVRVVDPGESQEWHRVLRALRRLHHEDTLDYSAGYWSIVLIVSTCPDMVLKISPNKNRDNGWLYLRWAAKQRDSQSPLVYAVQDTKNISYTIMEKLYHGGDSFVLNQEEYNKAMDYGYINDSAFFKRVTRVFNFAYRDLAYENVMTRADGSIVITDPVSKTRYDYDQKDVKTRNSHSKRRQGMIRKFKAAA